jgi:adenine/guanine phosphoribosyltransferase-like PRPP-binding protein
VAKRGASGLTLHELRELSEIAQGDLVAAAVLVASNESGLEVIADKTEHMVMS